MEHALPRRVLHCVNIFSINRLASTRYPETFKILELYIHFSMGKRKTRRSTKKYKEQKITLFKRSAKKDYCTVGIYLPVTLLKY